MSVCQAAQTGSAVSPRSARQGLRLGTTEKLALALLILLFSLRLALY